MALDVQLEGSIKFATVDPDTGLFDPLTLEEFGDEITSLKINPTRATIARPATFANATEVQRAGSISYQLTINFFGDETTAEDFWALAWTAITNTPCELYFEALLKPEPMGAANPKFAGYVMVTGMEAGGTVNEYKQQSQTWPARDVIGPVFV